MNALPEYAGRVLTLTALDVGESNRTYPGNMLRVRVEGPMSPLDMVIIVYPGGGLVHAYSEVSGSNNGVIEIPDTYIGTFEISAIGKLGKDKMVASNDLPMFIDPKEKTPPAVITAIRVEPKAVHLPGRGYTTSLQVIATYSDGVERDVAADGLGTTYEGESPFWIFGQDGVVVGRSIGTGRFVVSNSGHSESVTVVVEEDSPINNLPHAHAGNFYTACDSQYVQLDGSKSYDFDEGLGDVLTYEWDLDSDGEFDDASGETPRVQLLFPGKFWMVALRVKDAAGEESTDYATIEVGPECVIRPE